MTMSTRLLPARTRSSILFSRSCYPFQIHREDHLSLPLRYMTSPVRHMGFFQEFSNRLKGELEKNPELQKSIQELKANSGDLRSRSKETMNVMFKHMNSLRENTELKAKQASSVMMEKIHETKEAISGVASQVKESVQPKNNQGADFVEPDKGDGAYSATASGQGNDEQSSKPDTKNSSNFSHAFNVFSSTSSKLLERIKMTMPLKFIKEGYSMVKEELTSTSSRRAKEKVKAKAKHHAASTAPRSTCTDVVPVVRKQTAWEKRWDFFRTKAESNRMYKRFKGVKKHPLYVKGQEIVEDFRERWETSDSPMVHRIQDLNESIFGETATAMALKEIRKRDMTFSFPDFLAEVQENARDVLQAYLKGDIEELQKRCTREVIDRCRAERRAYESQGIFFDNKILHISDIELRDTKLMGNVPIIIVTFQTQQVFCVRDKNGKITQGAKDDILTVHYAWAMQQVSPEEMDEDELFPQWQLREMQQLGVRAII